MKKDIEYYIKLPWTYRIEYDPEEKVYFARVSEIKYCMAHGDTPEEAISSFRTAFKIHLEVMIENGEKITEPVSPKKYKGRITYRTSPTLHYKLARRAEAEGKSISKLIDELIENAA